MIVVIIARIAIIIAFDNNISSFVAGVSINPFKVPFHFLQQTL